MNEPVILAIVGSTYLKGNKEAEDLIERMLDKYKPTKVISGGAVGIDTMGVDAAKARNIPTHHYAPDIQKWESKDGQKGFKERNTEIANNCTHLVRIISSKTNTYGSGYTRDLAIKQGKWTETFTIKQ